MSLMLSGLCRRSHRSGDDLYVMTMDNRLYICYFDGGLACRRQIVGIGRHNHSYITLRRLVVASKRKPDAKAAALAETRTLNPRPETVRDEQFVSSEFFDARDVVQVKYEMVR